MPYPAYWPADDKFKALDEFLNSVKLASARYLDEIDDTDYDRYKRLAELRGIENFLLNKYQASGKYTVAELTDVSMSNTIGNQISNTQSHSAGYKQDKYAPARAWKHTPAGPGQTTGKDIKEWLGMKRMAVNPNEWGVMLILVVKNANRWTKFEDCRANFDASGVDATTDFQNITWYCPKTNNFPLIDAKRGECHLWSGQALDILHGVMKDGFQRVHIAPNADVGYGALGRGNYFTDKFSKSLLYAMNLRNEYFGAAKGSDIRVLMLSRVLLGNYMSLDNASKQDKKVQRFAHNLELTGSAQQHKLNTGKYENSVKLIRDQKLTRGPIAKGFKQGGKAGLYQISGENRDSNIGKESAHMTHKGSNEFLVAIGKQVYPEFLVFVKKN